MTPFWLLRLTRWARQPPSRRRMYLILTVLVLCLGLAAAEWFGLLPDSLGLPTGRQMPKARPVP